MVVQGTWRGTRQVGMLMGLGLGLGLCCRFATEAACKRGRLYTGVEEYEEVALHTGYGVTEKEKTGETNRRKHGVMAAAFCNG